jgi:hypothetical protein
VVEVVGYRVVAEAVAVSPLAAAVEVIPVVVVEYRHHWRVPALSKPR